MINDQKPKQNFVNTVLPIIGMVILIIILTKAGLPSWLAIGGPIAVLVVFGGIKQSFDTKKTKESLEGNMVAQNQSRITTTKNLNLIKIDEKELFSDHVDLAAGEYTISLRHERIVLTKVVSTNFYNVNIKTLAGQVLTIGWHYTDDNYASESDQKIELEFDYIPIV